MESALRTAQDAPIRRPIKWRGGDALRNARTCYSHLAGRVAVAIVDGLVARAHVILDHDGAVMTDSGRAFLECAGIDLAEPSKRKAFCRACLDWSERRPHLAGAVGDALLAHAIRHQWVQRVPDSRALTVTAVGQRALFHTFGVSCG